MFSLKLNLIGLFILSFLSITSYADSNYLNIEMKWEPTTSFKEVTSKGIKSFAQKKVKVEHFKDERKASDSSLVGKNIEESKEKIVTTKSDIAAYFTDGFKKTLTGAGIDLVDSGETYSVSGSVKHFFVTEKDTYVGDITVFFVIKKDGKQIWSGSAVANNKRFGRSFKLDNYQETFSDMVIEAAKELFSNPEFKEKI